LLGARPPLRRSPFPCSVASPLPLPAAIEPVLLFPRPFRLGDGSPYLPIGVCPTRIDFSFRLLIFLCYVQIGNFSARTFFLGHVWAFLLNHLSLPASIFSVLKPSLFFGFFLGTPYMDCGSSFTVFVSPPTALLSVPFGCRAALLSCETNAQESALEGSLFSSCVHSSLMSPFSFSHGVRCL